MAEPDLQKNENMDSSADMEDWTKEQVREWAISLKGVDDEAADALCHDTYRYMEGSILDVTESGPVDFIEPCHEYKAFTNTTDETTMIKFTAEVIRFAAACMNSRTNEVNGTILSLLSDNRKSSQFLPGAGGGRVLLEKKVERQLTTLDVLCVNQCDGGTENQDDIEQNFYRGGEVSWWNFYLSEQPGAVPFIKRDKFVYIVDTLIPDLSSLRKACVLLNLLHLPGCGGTTLAKHVLWALREKFRSAVLIDNDAILLQWQNMWSPFYSVAVKRENLKCPSC
ncbi:hypothetical protein WMY93_002176 [Mugilogobius chulae]|uniref:SAM domain-containing protein n=1 Tax=Mugilogobius chulae TaxID=88201 RepID=A0AAW0PV32_9GOBI